MEFNKEQAFQIVKEQVLNRKAMFIPIFCLSAFGLVGYATADRTAPVIHSDHIQVLYGSKLTKGDLDITDNRDKAEALDVNIDQSSFDANQLGTYNVHVTAMDAFQNKTEKTITVDVVDTKAPELSAINGNGYIVDVDINGSNDITHYLKATDNVDGDVSAFIQLSKKLDTSKLGSQTIEASVKDNAGNVTKQAYTFVVADKTAPTIKLKDKKEVTLNYGDKFDYHKYVTVNDNSKEKVNVSVDGNIDNKKEGTYSITLKAKDSSGNESQTALDVKVKDVEAPELKLSKYSYSLTKGDSIKASSFIKSAIDNKDGDVENKVDIDGKVNTNKVGTYTLSYEVKDKAGNKATKTLKVRVKEKETVASTDSSSAKASSVGSGVIGTAYSKVGSAYAWGSSGPTAFDCSGFTQYVLGRSGVSIPRTSGAQYAASSKVSYGSLQAGDLVFFSGTTGSSGITHVGLYIGGGKMIHAGSPRTGVAVANINNSYWQSHFVSGGRY